MSKRQNKIPSFEICAVKPSIDHGAAGSKSVKVNRSAIWHIKCKGEPPPKFLWYKDGHLLQSSGAIQIQSDEYQVNLGTGIPMMLF